VLLPDVDMRFFRFSLLSFIISGMLWGAVASMPAQASGGLEYAPPEAMFAEDLHQKVTLPGRINLNQASLNQLAILPGFDVDLALKVMRSRPFSNLQDFYQKMPSSSHRQLNYLLDRLQALVNF
jgi:hypothetical protein